MDNIRVPVSVCSYISQNLVATPNNGLLYIGSTGFKIGYIGNVTDDIPQIDIFHINSAHSARSIDCDPNWDNDQQYATLLNNNVLHIWDINKHQPIYGHQALVDPKSQTGAMCYLKSKQIIAFNNNRCAIYCISSNTYTVHEGIQLTKSNQIVLLKKCPFDDHLIAAGTKNGLALIFNVKDMTIVHKLRGHDSEITSIDWNLFNICTATKTDAQNRKEVKNVKKTVEIDPNDSPFDIYAFNYDENEFGALSSCQSVKEESKRRSLPQNEKFQFVEACQSLKEDILRGNKVDNNEENEVHLSEILSAKDDESNVSNHSELCDTLSQSESSNESVVVENTVKDSHSENAQEDTQEAAQEENINDKQFVPSIVTTSREQFIWIWDLENGAAFEKISFKFSQKSLDHGLVAKWLNNESLIVYSSSGDLVTFNVSLVNKKLLYKKSVLQNKENLIFNVAIDPSRNIIWMVGLKRKIICANLNDFDKKIASYSTLADKLHTMQESPHDANKIAIAGKTKSIHVVDASSFSSHSMNGMSYSNRIKAQVICVAWHPVTENLLAFSTNEGRVGILNITKACNSPVLMKPFTTDEVYTISWGLITDKFNSDPHWALFASSKNKLVYFPEKDKENRSLCEDKRISTVSAGKIWLSVGSQDGHVYILNLNGLEILASSSVSNRYVSDCTWNSINDNVLAVSSDTPDIYLFDCSNVEKDKEMKKIGILKGHVRFGVPSVKWSNENEHRLVSSGCDGTVRVWNTETLECISLFQTRHGASFCAMFWPPNENYVICSGSSDTLYMYDIRNRMDKYNPKQTNFKDTECNIHWAKHEERHIVNLISKERDKNRKAQRKARQLEIAQITELIKDVELCEGIDEPKSDSIYRNRLQLNHITIFHLSSKEFNKKVMDILNEVIFQQVDESNRSLHSLLFSDKEKVKELMEIEFKNHKNSRTNSVGHILIPQLTFNLENEINDIISKKQLTEQHVSLAPMISFDFWKKCSTALANQYLEKQLILLAVPYLLAVHEANKVIEQLYTSKYYREAWVVAKMYKEHDDPIFIKIATEWSQFLEGSGNFDGAALIAVSVEKFEMAHRLLCKKRTKSDVIDQMIEVLSKRFES